VTRGPAHAGPLPVWERLVFALVFALMAAFVVAMTMTAAGGKKPGSGPKVIAAGSAHMTAGAGGLQVGAAGPANQADPAATDGSGRRALLDRQLAGAMRPVVQAYHGHIAIGVLDASTGAEAVYGAGRRFRTASIEKVDILAALLLEHQRAGRQLTDREGQLAVSMIEAGDDAAASGLWHLDGGDLRLAAANAVLGLSHTTVGPPGSWDLSWTTVPDQLRLLADLCTADSPLTSQSRDYALGLMEDVQPGQRWGVSAAAGSGTSFAIKDGWLPDPLWVVNSIGIVEHGGHQLLIAVLASGQRTKQAGIKADSAAAQAAARIVTGAA
jgi:hypothetical protein